MHANKLFIDRYRKQPRPIIQDQDRKIPVSSGLETKTAVSRTASLHITSITSSPNASSHCSTTGRRHSAAVLL